MPVNTRWRRAGSLEVYARQGDEQGTAGPDSDGIRVIGRYMFATVSVPAD